MDYNRNCGIYGTKQIAILYDLTSYFSFYDIVFKISIVVGTFAFGIVNEITGDLRKSVLSLAFFFVVGLMILLLTNFQKAEEAVKV